MFVFAYLVACLLAVVNSWSSPFPASQQYLIDSTTQYKFYWDADTTNKQMRVGLEINTIGWVGFGISQNGGMVGSDVFIAYVYSNSTAVLNDRLATAKMEPGLDVDNGGTEDWSLLSSSRSGTTIQIEAKRAFHTGDSRDLDFVAGNMDLIFSYYTGDPDNAGFLPLHQHTQPFPGNTLTLFGTGGNGGNTGINTTGFPADYQNLTIQFPTVSIPLQETSYYCVGAVLTNTSGPAQAIAFQPVVVNKARLHHFVLYGCTSDYSTGQQPFECSSMPNGCINVMWAWAVGGNTFYTPSDVGILYGQAPFHYVVLQAHYDNSPLVPNQYDNSGVNIYYTYTPRIHTAGFLMLGAQLNKIALPPKKSAYTVGGSCDSAYTYVIPPTGFTVFATFLHMHKLGRKIRTSHVRGDGTVLPDLGSNMFYDFTFQKISNIEPIAQLLAYDNLTTYCTYDTSNQTGVTYGGESTENEMCFNFLAYYPFNPVVLGCSGHFFQYEGSLDQNNNSTKPNGSAKIGGFLLWTILSALLSIIV